MALSGVIGIPCGAMYSLAHAGSGGADVSMRAALLLADAFIIGDGNDDDASAEGNVIAPATIAMTAQM